MREIIFRGKRTDNGEWVYGCLLNNIYGASKPLIISDSSYTDDNRVVNDDCEFVKPETIGQYTGLTDKNGKKIFEGDIIKYTRTHWNEPLHTDNRKDLISLHEIYYDKNQAAFKQLHILQYQETRNQRQYTYRVIGSGLLSSFNDSRAEENIIEVIGNIHDNLELTERSNQNDKSR